MPRVEIDADQVLTAAVKITAERGDSLIVMDGAVVAVERRPHQQSEAPKVNGAMREITPFTVLDHLKKVGPVTARTIGDHFHLGPEGRRELSQVIKIGLHRLRLFRAENDSRIPRYVPTDYGNDTGGA
jgi:hypothetical protein